ncbi:MAG TPA: choice-of-anchor P family protein [Granulicella sp.]
MSIPNNERVYYYNASASPIGGTLTHPKETVLHSHSSVALSQAGGHSESHAESFKHDETLHTGKVYAQVTGTVHPENRNWTTHVTSVVEKVNVLEVVTADRIVAQIALEYPRDGYYPKVEFIGCQFENLRIGGKPVTPEIDLSLFNISPSDAKHAAKEEQASPGKSLFPGTPWPDVQSFVEKAVTQNERITSAKGVPDWLKRRYEWMDAAGERARKGYILCSLVNDVKGSDPNETFGHVLVVPGFGTVFLGEVIVDPKTFQLAMLRVELNHPTTTGQITFSAAVGNGRGMP